MNEFMQYETGATKEAPTGKGRFDLIPPSALQRLARRYEFGSAKYGDRNWEKGLPLSRLIDSCFRHLVCYLRGDTSEDHLAAVAWNVFALMEFEDRIANETIDPQIDDLPRYSPFLSRESK